MAKQKEVHFFDNETNFEQEPRYDIYHQYFDFTNTSKLKGEATPIYMYWYPAPSRMWRYNPHLKIIIILRNPITRAYSQWNMEQSKNRESLCFTNALLNEAKRCKDAYPLQHRIFSYKDRGFYSNQLNRVWSFFPKKQTLILKHEDFKKYPLQVLNKICDFLCVDAYEKIQAKEVHSTNYQKPMKNIDFNYLSNLYYHEIKSLEQVLDWDCSEWLQSIS